LTSADYPTSEDIEDCFGDAGHRERSVFYDLPHDRLGSSHRTLQSSLDQHLLAFAVGALLDTGEPPAMF